MEKIFSFILSNPLFFYIGLVYLAVITFVVIVIQKRGVKVMNLIEIDKGEVEKKSSLDKTETKKVEVVVMETKSNQKQARYNIVVLGKTGVGKSQLIKYLISELPKPPKENTIQKMTRAVIDKAKDVAKSFGAQGKDPKSGVGLPITEDGFHPYDSATQDGIPITLFDTAGITIDNSKKWLRQLKYEISEKKTSEDITEWFHTIFYCFQSSGGRIEEFELNTIRELIDQHFRVVVVFTKADVASEADINELKKKIKEKIKEQVFFVNVCSEGKKLSDGHATQPFGVDNLFQEISQGFLKSITGHIPDKCINDLRNNLDTWYNERKDYTINKSSYADAQDIFDTLQSEERMFLTKINEDLRQVVFSNIEYISKKYGEFGKRIRVNRNKQIKNSEIEVPISSMNVGWEIKFPALLLNIGTLGLSGAGKTLTQSKLLLKLRDFIDELRNKVNASRPIIENIIRSTIE